MVVLNLENWFSVQLQIGISNRTARRGQQQNVRLIKTFEVIALSLVLLQLDVLFISVFFAKILLCSKFLLKVKVVGVCGVACDTCGGGGDGACLRDGSAGGCTCGGCW